MKYRKEFDSIGKINVPNYKYWGASTERSKKFFDIGELYVQEILIKSKMKKVILVNFDFQGLCLSLPLL